MESISQDYYVYTYRYPESMGGSVFYVGKGQGDRIDQHEFEAKGKWRACNAQKVAIIREIWAAGEQVVKRKEAFFVHEKDAYLYEWALINMTTYADKLTNIYRGKGYPHRIDLKEIDYGQYGDVCIQRHQGRGNNAYLIIYHKVSDIKKLCEKKAIGRESLLRVITGKETNVRGYSIRKDCKCKYTSMTLERIHYPKITPREQERIAWEKRRKETKNTALMKGSLELGRQIRQARQALGLTAKDLADMIMNKNGECLLKSTIYSYENGWKYPSQNVMKQLKSILGLEIPENG